MCSFFLCVNSSFCHVIIKSYKSWAFVVVVPKKNCSDYIVLHSYHGAWRAISVYLVGLVLTHLFGPL